MQNINHIKLNQILCAQNKALGLVVSDAPLTECLNQICLLLESSIPESNFYAGISLNKEQSLHCECAPSLPIACVDAIRSGQKTTVKLGSTADSILTKLEHIFSDLSQQAHWPQTTSALQNLGILSCVSWPILCDEKQVLGSLDIYFKQIKTPDSLETALIQHFAQFAAVTIEKNKNHSKQQALNKSIQESHQRMQAFSQLIPDLMFVLSNDGTIEDLFGGNKSLLLMAQSEFLGKKHSEVLPLEVSIKVKAGIERALQLNKIQVIHYSLKLPIGKTDFEGRIIPAEQDSKTMAHRILYMARDVTQQNKDKAQIEKLAYYDDLTQLANRSLLMNQLEKKITTVNENQLHGALIFLDLDDFKKINDSLGHSIGDEFLIMIGVRLKQCMPPSATLARIGGDEFVVLLDELSVDRHEIQSHAASLAQKLINNIQKPFFYNQVEYQMGCSIGICVFNDAQAVTADQILQQADMCMYQAKKRGGQQMVVYDEQFIDATAQRFQIESDIQKGIKNNSFHAHFQPQIDKNGHIISAEALIRWQIDGEHHAHPAEFIPIAENSSLINELQQIVLEQSCQLIQQVDCLLGHHNFTLSINISANQFRTQLGQMLLETIMPYGLEPQRFKLEITESVLLERSQVVTEQIELIQAMGFQFSIDDFGMGYSSLAYLNDLPVNELKIDKAFIKQNTHNKKQRAIVKAITTLAKEMELDVIVEGVESEQQHQLLQGLDYTALQGFLFSKPQPFTAFIALVKQQTETQEAK